MGRWTLTCVWRGGVLLASLFLAALAASCGSAAGKGQPSQHSDNELEVVATQQSAPGLAAYAPVGEPGGDTAALAGTLMDAGECLFVRTAEGESVIPVFPSDRAHWDGQTLTVPGGQEFVVGDAGVSLTGGYRTELHDDFSIPVACPAEYAYFQVANF